MTKPEPTVNEARSEMGEISPGKDEMNEIGSGTNEADSDENSIQSRPRKSKAKPKGSDPSAKSAEPDSRADKPVAGPGGGKVVLLSGGNPQIAKGDGDAPVQAYIAAMPGRKSELGKRLDELIVQTVPGVRKAVRWNSPFYGLEGQGWFLSFHVLTRYVKVTFFAGMSLQPIPPGGWMP